MLTKTLWSSYCNIAVKSPRQWLSLLIFNIWQYWLSVGPNYGTVITNTVNKWPCWQMSSHPAKTSYIRFATH